MSHVIVVGGGAAGMFAAIAAAKNGHQVTLYEKNEKLGKKIFITGKGRCNITNAADMEELFDAVVTNSKFLYSSFYGYTNQNVIDFFEDAGVPVKMARERRERATEALKESYFVHCRHVSDTLSTEWKLLPYFYVDEYQIPSTGLHCHHSALARLRNGFFPDCNSWQN